MREDRPQGGGRGAPHAARGGRGSQSGRRSADTARRPRRPSRAKTTVGPPQQQLQQQQQKRGPPPRARPARRRSRSRDRTAGTPRLLFLRHSQQAVKRRMPERVAQCRAMRRPRVSSAERQCPGAYCQGRAVAGVGRSGVARARVQAQPQPDSIAEKRARSRPAVPDTRGRRRACAPCTSAADIAGTRGGCSGRAAPCKTGRRSGAWQQL